MAIGVGICTTQKSTYSNSPLVRLLRLLAPCSELNLYHVKPTQQHPQCKKTAIETTPTQEMIVYHVRVGLSGCSVRADTGKCATFSAFARAKVDITMC
jgi:hypothetical protein